MKICKNCGYQAGEDKIRCPSCGYLFEEDMDNVLRQMRTNLNTYKQEISALPAAPAQQASAAQAPAAPAAAPEESASADQTAENTAEEPKKRKRFGRK